MNDIAPARLLPPLLTSFFRKQKKKDSQRTLAGSDFTRERIHRGSWITVPLDHNNRDRTHALHLVSRFEMKHPLGSKDLPAEGGKPRANHAWKNDRQRPFTGNDVS